MSVSYTDFAFQRIDAERGPAQVRRVAEEALERLGLEVGGHAHQVVHQPAHHHVPLGARSLEGFHPDRLSGIDVESLGEHARQDESGSVELQRLVVGAYHPLETGVGLKRLDRNLAVPGPVAQADRRSAHRFDFEDARDRGEFVKRGASFRFDEGHRDVLTLDHVELEVHELG